MNSPVATNVSWFFLSPPRLCGFSISASTTTCTILLPCFRRKRTASFTPVKRSISTLNSLQRPPSQCLRCAEPYTQGSLTPASALR